MKVSSSYGWTWIGGSAVWEQSGAPWIQIGNGLGIGSLLVWAFRGSGRAGQEQRQRSGAR